MSGRQDFIFNVAYFKALLSQQPLLSVKPILIDPRPIRELLTFLPDFWGQSQPALHLPPLPLRGGDVTLFGSYDRIWSAARGAAVRGFLLVTLSPNCGFDSERRDRQSKGEAIHSSCRSLLRVNCLCFSSRTRTIFQNSAEDI